MLSGGRWRPIPPMSGPRYGARSVIIDTQMWVMGGDDEDRGADGRGLQPQDELAAVVHADEPAPCGAVAGVVGGRLVVAGGSLVISSVERARDRVDRSRLCRTCLACRVRAERRLYVMGG